MAKSDNNAIPMNALEASNIGRKIASGEELSILEKLSMFQIFSRKWRRHLTPNEIVLVAYVIDRTVSWGNASFRACHGNILKGTDDYAGCGLTRSVYMTTLKALETKGTITRKRARDFVIIALNFDWNPEKTLPRSKPKRLQPGQKSSNRTSKSPESDHPEVQHLDTEYDSMNTIIQKGSVAVAPNTSVVFEEFKKELFPEEKKEELHPSAKSAEVFVSASDEPDKQLTEAQCETAQKSLTKKNPSSNDFENVWRTAIAETFPKMTIVGWGIREKGQMNKAAKKWPSQNTNTFAELIDWSCRNWPQIIRMHFGWMKDQPINPTLQFFTSDKLRARLAGAMMDGDIQRFANSVDVDELQRRMLAGQSRDDAVAEIAKAKAMALTREETNKKLRQAVDLNEQSKMNVAKADRRLQLARINTAENIAEKLAEKGVTVKPAHKTDTSRPLVQTIENYDEKLKAARAAKWKKTPVRERNPKMHVGSKFAEDRRS